MRALVVTALVAAACPRVPASPADAASADDVPIYVDRVLVAHVAATIRGDVPLATLLPPEAADPSRWAAVDADGVGGRTLHLRHPSEVYPGAETRLYVGAHGALALGVFRPAAAIARPSVSLDRVSAIHVHTLAAHAGTSSTLTPTVFALVDAAGVHAVTRAQLEALPRTKPPRGPRAPTYDLRDVLTLSTTRAASVIVSPSEGEPVTLDAATLARPDRLALLKINRKGQRKLRVWALGATPSLIAELEDVARIEVR